MQWCHLLQKCSKTFNARNKFEGEKQQNSGTVKFWYLLAALFCYSTYLTTNSTLNIPIGSGRNFLHFFQTLYTSNFHQRENIFGRFLQCGACAPRENQVGKLHWNECRTNITSYISWHFAYIDSPRSRGPRLQETSWNMFLLMKIACT